jgi:hypothetical protein
MLQLRGKNRLLAGLIADPGFLAGGQVEPGGSQLINQPREVTGEEGPQLVDDREILDLLVGK